MFHFGSRLHYLLLVVVVSFFCQGLSQDENSQPTKTLNHLQEMYDNLPPKGKFATGCAVGFGGSRLAVKSAVGVVKVVGAAYVVTEVLNAAGVLDDIPSFSEDQIEIAENIKRRALTAASSFRQQIRTRLNPEKIKSFMAEDKMAAMGIATGAFVGFML